MFNFSASAPTTPTTGSTSGGSEVPASTGKSSSGKRGFAVIGGAVGAVLLAVIAVAVGVVLWRKRKQQSNGTVCIGCGSGYYLCLCIKLSREGLIKVEIS